MDRIVADERALASGVIIFVAMLVVGALMFVMFDQAASDVISASTNHTSDTAAQDQIDLMEQFWEAVLFFVVFVATLFLIARAVIESRRP